MTFQDLGLSAPILRAVSEDGYETPTPIQAHAIPEALTGRSKSKTDSSSRHCHGTI